jgi:hypothetical protein
MHQQMKAAPAEPIRRDKRRIAGLLATLVLAFCVIGSSAPSALAATATMGPVTKVFSTSAHVTGDLSSPVGTTFWRFDVSSDGVNWSLPEGGYTGEEVTSAKSVEADLRGLAPETAYFVRFAVVDLGLPEGEQESLSAEPNPSFTTTAPVTVAAPVVLTTDDASEVGFSSAKASGEVERAAGEDPLFDASCAFEYISDEQFDANPPGEGFNGAAQAACDPNPVTAPGASSVKAILTGLTAGTTYHLRLVASNSAGADSKAAASTFTTQAATPPALTVEPAANVKFTEAQISGTVDPEGGNVNPADGPVAIGWQLQYTRADEPGNWQAIEAGEIKGEDAKSDTPIAVGPAQLTGLANATEYRFRLLASYAGKEAVSGEGSFTTGTVDPPSVTVDPASSLSATGAVFSGTVTPGNLDPAFNSTCEFDYVPLPRSERQRLTVKANGGVYRLSIDGAETVSIDFDASASAVQEALEGLSAVGAGNVTVSGGSGIHPYVIVFGGSLANQNLSELAVLATKEVASGSLVTTLSGNAALATATQGSDGAFATGSQVPCDINPVIETEPPGPIEVEAAVTDLEPNTTYHLRLRAENQGGEATAVAPDFTTDAAAPAILDTAVSDADQTTATLHAEINPGGAPTTFHFEYLTDAAYQAASGSFAGATPTPESSSIGADNEGHAAEAAIEDLAPDTVYRYRVVATNSKAPAGIVSQVRTFKTKGAPVNETEDCPNEAVRQQQASTFLPECRAYEIVNSPGLDSGEANRVPSVADDGETVAYSSVILGDDSFGGGVSSISVARRGPGGWTQENANPATRGALWQGTGITEAITFSSDFRMALIGSTLPADPSDQDGDEDFYRVITGTGVAEPVAPVATSPFSLVGATSSLDRIVFDVVSAGAESGIYSYDGSQLVRLSVDEKQDPIGTAVRAGTGADRGYNVGLGSGAHSPFVERGGSHAVSDDTQRVYFYSKVANFSDIGNSGPLYLNDHGISKPISTSQRLADAGEAPAPAQFISASHDGSSVYFNSIDQLTDAATPGGGIYRYEVPTEELTLLTPAADDSTGLHLGGAIASDDQSHIYFTSSSDLAAGAVVGERNAYVWSAGEGVRFIASVGPTDLFNRVTPNGRYALMLTQTSIDGAPNAGFRALYRYDDGTEQLACVSCRPDGSPSQGEAQIEGQSGGNPNAPTSHSRALTFDGRVVFASTDRLVSADQTAAQDVYVYDEGKLSLLSSGREKTDSFIFDVSDDGNHAIITSRAALVPSDRDPGEYDVYDVAVGGGFLEVPEAAACEGEACRGAGTMPAGGAPFASSSFAGAPNPRPCAKGKVRRNGRCVKPRKHRKKYVGKSGKGKKRGAKADGRQGR